MAHNRTTARIIRLLGTEGQFGDWQQIEDSILAVITQTAPEQQGFFSFFSSGPDQEQEVVLDAAIKALGKIGGSPAAEYLQQLAAKESPHAELARTAPARIRARAEGSSPPDQSPEK